jgi:hypothetical protein
MHQRLSGAGFNPGVTQASVVSAESDAGAFGGLGLEYLAKRVENRMVTPCSVNANGRNRTLRRPGNAVANCDRIASASPGVS